jgi:hypothetical protein
MDLNIARELADLKKRTVKQLRDRFAEVFGEATRANNRDWLIKRIVWRLQAKAEGDLSERARRRAEELADEAYLRTCMPKDSPLTESVSPTRTARLPDADNRLPLPGTVIRRDYKGVSVQVKVTDDGFEYEGEVYKTLSAVAKAITGSHCNGFLFFKLGKYGGEQ